MDRRRIVKLKLHRIIEADAGELLNKVIELPFTQFVSKFKQIADNPKIQAVLNAGLTDGKPSDERLTYSEGMIECLKLRPSQNIIGQKESLDNILTNRYGNLDYALKGNLKFPTPLIIYNQEYIVDGHHRWSQIFCANPKCKINVVNIRGSLHPLELLKVIHMAVALDVKEVPLSEARGINLLQASKREIYEVVENVVLDDVIQKYYNAKVIDTPSVRKLQEYIWRNVLAMQVRNAPIPNAPDRSFMPQTDDADVIAKVKSGEINFINPKSSDVKESLTLINIWKNL